MVSQKKIIKCYHPENKGNECKADFCPRGLWQGDWEELVEEGCGYSSKRKKKK